MNTREPQDSAKEELLAIANDPAYSNNIRCN